MFNNRLPLLLAVLCTISVTSISCDSRGETTISYGKSDVIISNSLEIGGFIFDTGATHSVIFGDNEGMDGREFVSDNKISDANNRGRILKLYRVKSMSAGSLTIDNGEFLNIDKENLPEMLHAYRGIIGMNIIDKANWLIDIKRGEVTVLNKDSVMETKADALILEYNNENSLPETRIKLGNQVLRKIIIDTGSHAVLELLSSDIRELDKFYESSVIDTVRLSGLYNGITEHPVHNYKNVPLNHNHLMESLEAYDVKRERRIGFGFFKEFDYILIDTYRRKIYLYN